MSDKREKNEERVELNEFQLRNIKLLTHLLTKDAIDDEIVEELRLSELDYFSLLDKYKLLEKKVNIDEKTNLLKFKKNYLTDIIKTASRVYFGTEKFKYFISFVRFDIDDFSQFNNKYGHHVGDEVLVMIATIIRENSRPTDYAIRFGGEEFDVILPGTTIENATLFLDKIFKKIRDTKIKYKDEILSVTVSAGLSVTQYPFSDGRFINDGEIEKKFAQLQNEADNALYEAKYLGKDQYCLFSVDKIDEYPKIRKLYVKE